MVFLQRFLTWDGPKLAREALHDPVARFGTLLAFQGVHYGGPFKSEVAERDIDALAKKADAGWLVGFFENVAANDCLVVVGVADDIVLPASSAQFSLRRFHVVIGFRTPGADGLTKSDIAILVGPDIQPVLSKP